MKAILEVTGCCNRYRAQMIITPDKGQIITIDALGPSAQQAYAKLLELAGAIHLPGFDPTQAKVRHWTNK
jgi:hypothetical protein